jgi:hypothetical protein
LLARGVAPAQPALSAQNPSIDIELVRNDTSWTSGTLRATTADQEITLGVITFGGGT